MELFCEERFINFPPDVEFHLNGVDAGEFVGENPKLDPIGTPRFTDEEDWDNLNAENNKIVFGSDAPPEKESANRMFSSHPDELKLPENVLPYNREVHFQEMISDFGPYKYSLYSAQDDFRRNATPDNTPNVYLYQCPNLYSGGLEGSQRNTVPTVYKKKIKNREEQYCVFCKNNNAPFEKYTSHTVKDSLGKVTCPRLFQYVCPICKKSKHEAHTVKYCPEKHIYTMEDTIRMNFRSRRSYRID
ncbi:NANOS [Sergentomyia squamirostris]